MIKITKLFVGLVLCLIVTQVNAQDSTQIGEKTAYLNKLEAYKETIKIQEKEELKSDLEIIQAKLDSKTITKDQAEQLKKGAAKNRALNITNRIAILDNKMDLIKRDETWEAEDYENRFSISIGGANKEILGIKGKKRKVKYDIRTSNDLLLAFGFNNAITENQSFNQTPFENLGSSFIELGWHWKTRLYKNSNWARVKYGFAFQWNKLNLKDDLYFVQDANKTRMEKFPTSLRKSQLRNTNLVVPLYFEFGPSAKVEKKDRIRFNTWGKFKIGLGGYAGVRLDTQQKLKYKEDGQSVKQKINKSYNASDFVYGLGAYIGINDIAIYAKYDLSPVFRDQAIDMNNISLGVRFDID